MADPTDKKEKKKKPEAGAKKSKGKGKKDKSKSGYKVSSAEDLKITPASGVLNLRKRYQDQVSGELKKKFSFKNREETPRLKKVVINCCMKTSVGNPKVLDSVMDDLTLISGQRPVLTRARKSIAAFKLRQNLPIGARVTLRRARMYEFLDRLINIALPRVRDFKGISDKSFDGRGNYSLGVREHIIFPEINYDKADHIFGFTVTIETTAKSNEHGRELLHGLGMPFAS